MDADAGAVVLHGPQGVGTSTIAGLLRRAEVHHVDPDVLVLELPASGWPADPQECADVVLALIR